MPQPAAGRPPQGPEPQKPETDVRSRASAFPPRIHPLLRRGLKGNQLGRNLTSRLHFRRQLALGSVPDTKTHMLTFPQLGQTGAPQDFHMDEDVGRARPTRQETVPLGPVEPFDMTFQ